MPGFDGTGPEGKGPLTGGAGGDCVERQPHARLGLGRALGRGTRRGIGRGAGRGLGLGGRGRR